MLEALKKDFKTLFKTDIKHTHTYFAPGRVNIIGEHTDYNGGHVFPCALSFGIYAIVSTRTDSKVAMYSTNFKEIGMVEFSIENWVNEKSHNWANYPKGVMKIFAEHGYKMTHGLDIVLGGDIPNNAGLSSSACIELLTAIILDDIFQFNIHRIEMIKMCQEAENKFIGVNCGIMDQFAIGMGKKDHAILLDCNTLKYEYAPLKMEGYKIVIANTNKKRALGESKYNERRSECEHALSLLQTKLKINALGNLSEKEFEDHKYLITNPIEQKRAKHAVYENQRTLKAVEALLKNDLVWLGKLMNLSHISLRDDYEVTGKELDTLVDLAWKQEGVVGSRMTGAGFGGCTVSIVQENKVNDFIKNVGDAYKKNIGYDADFYIANIGDGAKKIENMKDESTLKQNAQHFQIEGEILSIKPLLEGHINDTFIIETQQGKKYIFQRKNKKIFQDVPAMMDNIVKVTEHIKNLSKKQGGNPDRDTITIIFTQNQKAYFVDHEQEYWTMMLLIENCITFEKADTEEIAFQGGLGTGKFQAMLADFTTPLKDILPGFHNIKFRLTQWEKSLKEDNFNRKKDLAKEISWIEDRKQEMLHFWQLVETGKIPIRVTHNDTKISNFLFDKTTQKVLCAIDLDTVLSSTCLNDFGDAIRSYTNTGLEDDKNLDNVSMDMNMFKAYTRGYLQEAKVFLQPIEIDYLAFSARYIVYEQVLRFLMDYINGDTYYKIHYPNQNLVRTQAQYKLLQSIELQLPQMQQFVKDCI